MRRLSFPCCTALLLYTTASAQVFVNQGSSLAGTGAIGDAYQGSSVALSLDGNTALEGGPDDNNEIGAAWIFTRNSNGNWTQQGSKLVGSDSIGMSSQGASVALSADGNTALVGGPADNGNNYGGIGAVWIFTRDSTGNWTQQGSKLVGSGAVNSPNCTNPGGFCGASQGSSVTLSADGNTAFVGGPSDNSYAGAVWVFTRDSNGNWTQQGNKLVGSDVAGPYGGQGSSVALSADGNTVLEGGPGDNNGAGAVWIFTRDSNGNWTQQGSKLVGNGSVGAADQGASVALSADGNTALVGGPTDDGGGTIGIGGVWVFTRDGNGNWTQEGNKLVGSGAVNEEFGTFQGSSVALSADGNTALVDGPNDNDWSGAVWVFTRATSGIWTQQGSKLVTPGYSVALSGDGNTALGGTSADGAWPFVRAISEALRFVPITPCRVVDTRNAKGPFGGPEFVTGSERTFDISAGACNVPSTAAAYSLNITAVPNGKLGYLTVWPTGQSRPVASTLNSDGRVKANAAIIPAGSDGGINVFVTDTTQLILDIDGYFVPANTSAQVFYPLTPCRIADTRKAPGPLGGPTLSGGSSRTFPILSSSCSIPPSATAYSLNFTAVPHGPLGYLTIWPTGQSQPVVSTVNASTGTVTANAAIIATGASGEISIYASNKTDLVIDTNGYFAPPGTGGLSLYTITPCRALDTRSSSGEFSGILSVNLSGGACGGTLVSAAQGFVLNATVVPLESLEYLTLWPEGEMQPVVSTLNAVDSAITSNMAIIPTTNGDINSFAYNPTQLILDLSGFFAP